MSEAKRNKGGRPPYVPTEKDRAMVKTMASYSVTQDDIAVALGIGDDTLRKYYLDDLRTSKVMGLAKVKESLFWMATKGRNVSAAIFILKTQDGWREPPQSHEHTGKNGEPIAIITGVRRRHEIEDDAAD